MKKDSDCTDTQQRWGAAGRTMKCFSIKLDKWNKRQFIIFNNKSLRFMRKKMNSKHSDKSYQGNERTQCSLQISGI